MIWIFTLHSHDFALAIGSDRWCFLILSADTHGRVLHLRRLLRVTCEEDVPACETGHYFGTFLLMIGVSFGYSGLPQEVCEKENESVP